MSDHAAPNKPGAAGVLLFVHNTQVARLQPFLDELNRPGGVSDEVVALFCVKPTRDAVKQLADSLHTHPLLHHLESIQRLRANNALRDLTAPWRLPAEFVDAYQLVVGVEPIMDEFRKKYPLPNLTLQAGKIEPGESPLQAAKRELFEEARVKVANVWGRPIALMSKGMFMYPVFIDDTTQLTMTDGVLHIGPSTWLTKFYGHGK
jgi:hypothetical protein